jgi:hypothetical protein
VFFAALILFGSVSLSGSLSFCTARSHFSLPLSCFTVRSHFLVPYHFVPLSCLLVRYHFSWLALILLGPLSFYWPALIFDASLSFFFAALIFLCRYHFLWFALVFLARSCFDSSVLAALKMQPPRSWISKTCLGVNFGRANIDIRGRYHFGSVALTALNLKT